MIEQLFGSKTRVKLLGLFYQNPDRSYYVREITRKIDEQINSVRRELANLLSIGIISSDNSNNKLYYEVNKEFEHYEALSIMFGGRPKNNIVSKSEVNDNEKNIIITGDTALASNSDSNVESIVKAGNVRLLIYTGQFTRDETSGVDVVIVGDLAKSGPCR
jgi:predicted transcriptional regulator